MTKPGVCIADFASWPLMTLVIGGMLEDQNVAALFSSFDQALRREQPFIALADARTLLPDNPRGARHRSEMADYVKAHRHTGGRYFKGMAVLLSSRPVAIGLNAIFLLAPMPMPMHTASSPKPAVDWMTKLCAEQKMLTPALTQAMAEWAARG